MHRWNTFFIHKIINLLVVKASNSTPMAAPSSVYFQSEFQPPLNQIIGRIFCPSKVTFLPYQETFEA